MERAGRDGRRDWIGSEGDAGSREFDRLNLEIEEEWVLESNEGFD